MYRYRRRNEYPRPVNFSVATACCCCFCCLLSVSRRSTIYIYIFGWHGDSGVVAAKKGRRARNAAANGGASVSGEAVSADLKARGKKGEITNEQIAKTAAAASDVKLYVAGLEKSTTTYINEYVMCIL